MTIIKSGSSSYGHCWIENWGSYFIVYLMDGKTKKGPFSRLEDALCEYGRYCT